LLAPSPLRAAEPRPAAALSVEAIAKKTLPALVTVLVKDASGQLVRAGSGFFVAPQRVATNLHVVVGSAAVSVVTIDGKTFPVTAARVDEPHDLALLDCPSAAGAAVLALGDPAHLAVGETVVAAGSPLGMPGSISTGVVSARREVDGVTVIQTTAPISRGSSGGPLIDKQGRVVGVNSFMVADGQNLNFAQLGSHVAELLHGGGKPVDFRRGETVAGKLDQPDPNQAALLALLAQPLHSGPELRQRLLGAAELVLFDVRAHRAYFAIARADTDDAPERAQIDAAARPFVAEPSRLLLAEIDGLQARFPNYAFQRSPQKWLFFATDIGNLRLGTGGPLTFKYRDVAYVVSAGELRSFLENASLHGGPLVVDASSYDVRSLPNWGALVARPAEPSLSRLVKDLTAGLAALDAKLQRLTDFVAAEIETDPAPLATVRKKPSEVLLSRRGGISEKAALLASLLEQLPADYALVYSAEGAWVAVPQGRFKADNGLGFAFDGKPWCLIDVSRPGFVIGETTSPALPSLDALRFVQLPQQNQRIYSRTDGKPIGNL
jgi:Trypsin-like peptidase domain